jgi:hypothetical protein
MYLIVLNAIPEDGRQAETCWSVHKTVVSVCVKGDAFIQLNLLTLWQGITNLL